MKCEQVDWKMDLSKWQKYSLAATGMHDGVAEDKSANDSSRGGL